MSKEGVQKLVGRMITDEKFKKEVFQDPQKAIASSGYHIDPKEAAAISKIKPHDLQVVAKPVLDPGGQVASFNLDVRSATF